MFYDFLYLSFSQDEEMERLKKRGERFGTSVSPAIAKVFTLTLAIIMVVSC